MDTSRRFRLIAAMLFSVPAACSARSSGRDAVDAATHPKAAQAMAAPSYFVGGEESPELLAAIRERIDDKITFAGHYSTVFVDCGTACGSYWFVDRRTGAIIAVPDKAGEGQMLSEVKTDARSDLVELIYGPPGGFEEPGCSKQSFRWTGHEFKENSPPIPIKCPW